jgi:hypothetical protein
MNKLTTLNVDGRTFLVLMELKGILIQKLRRDVTTKQTVSFAIAALKSQLNDMK